MATASIARATTARRKSSDSCPALSTNAATSHDDKRTFVFFSVIVDIDRPRVGGVAINCSQIVSRQLSISEEAGGCAAPAAAADEVDTFDEEAGVAETESAAVTGFSSGPFADTSTGAPNCASSSADFT